MSVKTDVVNLLVRVNGDNAKKEFVELKAKAASLSAELNSMKKGTAEYIEKSKELNLVQSRYKALRGEMDLNSLSIKDLRQEIAKMKSQRAELDPTSDGFRVLGDRIHLAEGRMRDLNEGGTFLSRTFNFLKKEALGFGVVMLGALGIDYVIGKIGNLIQRQAELSDSFAQIRRTTGLSQKAVEDLNKSLSQIDTRTAKKDLRDIAVVLGQIGEPANVESIKAIDKIVVALGDEFKGGADEITSALSILRNNFTTFKTGDYAADIEHIGNALSVLGKSGIATAPVVTDMATRMSGVLGTFKVTAGQTLGLSAAMQEMGISVERGSTAVTKLVQKMAQNPEVFAKVAGAKTKKEVEDFIQLLNTDAISALTKVAEGSKKAGASNTEFAEILKELESTGAGVSEFMAKLAVNGEMVKEKMDLASDAIAKNDTIQNSFAISNENVAAKVAKLQKQFAALWESQAVTNFLKGAIDGAFNFIESLKTLGRFLEKNWSLIKGIVIAYGTYLIATGRIIAVKTIENTIDAAHYGWLLLNEKGTKAFALAKGVLTGQITLATAAQRIFNTVASANPFALMITLIAGVTVALGSYIKKIQDAKYEMDAMLSTKKLQADLKERSDVFKAENASILKDLQEGNKAKLKIDQAALDASNELRNEGIKQAKAAVAEQQKIADSSTRFAKSAGISGAVEKSQQERERDKKILDDKKADLDDLLAKQQDYLALRGQVAKKLEDIDTTQAVSAKELTAKQKAELEKRKTDYAKYLADLKKYKQELQDFYDKVEQAKIDVIEEEKASELASLDFKFKLESEKILAQTNTLIGESRNLKQSKEEQLKISEQSKFLHLALEEKYQQDRAALIQKYEDELNKGNYNNELKAVNDYVASQKLLYSQLYRDKVIDKNTYDNQIENLDISAKAKLVDIAQRYGIDVTKATQDLTDAEIKIMADGVERKKALLKREADFRVQLAEYNQQKDPSKSNLAEVYNAQIVQLGVSLQNEINSVKGGEEEKLQIYKEYNLKRQQLDDEFRANAAQQRQDEILEKGNAVMQYASIANDYAQQIFDFRRQKFEEELNTAQNTYNKENAALDQQYKNHLVSDVEYNNKKKQIQEKLDKEQRALKRKQAINDKIAALFSIGLNTGQAIMSALAGPWPASIAFAALAGAMGAVQLGFAASKEVPQFYTGGYSEKTKVKGAQDGRTYEAKILPGFGGGYLDQPSILVGERGQEYVTNNTMLNNPSVRYITDAIDALSNGRISQIDFDGMFSMPALQQKYSGGYSQQNTTIPVVAKNTADIYNTEIQLQLLAALGKLNTHLDSGIKAEARIGDNAIVDFKKRSTYLDSIENDAN